MRPGKRAECVSGNAAWLISLLGLAACASTDPHLTPVRQSFVNPPVADTAAPYPSTYDPPEAAATALRGATVLDGTGKQLDHATVLMKDGRIAAVGQSVAVPPDARVVDARGKWVTPGIIDVHSHLGLASSPLVPANADGNEYSNPNTAGVWAEHSIWPQDPGFRRALSGGVTTLQILPGSSNLFGGRSVVLKNVPSRTVQGMKFPDAPYGLKMACGENPKQIYGRRTGRAPITRMGSFSLYRAAWIKAMEYKRKRDEYEAAVAAGNKATLPSRDLDLDTLAGALSGEILVHVHCYRADEMAQMLDLADEFGFRITSFEHGVEAYKIADLLRLHDTCVSMWSDMWGYKMEAYDGIPENVAMIHAAGGCAVVHSDSELVIQRLNQEAAKDMYAGRRAGLAISKAEAWRWLSLNPARSLGIDHEVGSLEVGKAADVVLWSGDPFSVYSRAQQVYIDGVLRFDLADPQSRSLTDFEVGQPGARIDK